MVTVENTPLNIVEVQEAAADRMYDLCLLAEASSTTFFLSPNGPETLDRHLLLLHDIREGRVVASSMFRDPRVHIEAIINGYRHQSDLAALMISSETESV